MPRASARYEYRIDARDIIISVSPAWLAFALENDTPDLSEEQDVCGRSIWDSITGQGTRQIYQELFDRIRRHQRIITFPFRCDGPTVRRFMQMVMAPGPGDEIHHTGILLRAELTDPNPLLDAARPHSAEMLEACSFCRRVHLSDLGWAPVEDAVRHLNLFDKPAAPMLSHGCCPDCQSEFHRRLTA